MSSLASAASRLLDNVRKVVRGDSPAINHVVIALLAGGHVLLEDAPGVGKTILGKSLARSLDCDFARIQGTPDLLPSDLTGVQIYNQKEGTFEFRAGPLHHQIILMDEVNRATPKTQSALLEAMEERQVTVDGVTHHLPEPFLVVATQNPIEQEGTYPLPESQLDRFLLKSSLGYPPRDSEIAILKDQAVQHPIESLQPVLSAEEIKSLQAQVKQVEVSDVLLGYLVDLVRYTRGVGNGVTGVSPRGGLALRRAAQARAFLEGREYVTPEDIQELASVTLGHRVYSMTDASGRVGLEVVAEALEKVEVPV
ncbi:MAG: AAA family ATPase [Vulcanimicrobiota bacterium]